VKRVAEHPARSIGFLSRYHDGDLSSAERTAFDRHAAGCAECTTAAAEYEAVLTMYRESRLEPADPALARRISRRIGAELGRRPPVRFLALEIDLLWASVTAIGLVAAIALFAILGRRAAPVFVAENDRAAKPSPPAPVAAPEAAPDASSLSDERRNNRPAVAPERKATADPRRAGRSFPAEGGVEGGVPGGTAGGIIGGAPGSPATEAAPPGPTSDLAPSGEAAVPEPRTEPRESARAPLRVGAIVSAPVLLRRVEPAIPPAARRLLAVSPVVVEAVISENGDVVSTRIVRSNPAADRAVLDALRRWKYRAAVLDGRPVAVYLTITVRGE
jgi:protein TonB